MEVTIKGRGGDKRTMTKYTLYDVSSHTLLTLANTVTRDILKWLTTHTINIKFGKNLPYSESLDFT